MTVLTVEKLKFSFPAGWTAGKYDDWSFYRHRFGKMRAGIKAVDLVAVDDATAWFVEVKDYRTNPRTKPSDLAEEVFQKVYDTLAALLPAKLNGDVSGEVSTAGALLRAKRIRVVLHLEQPKKSSKLRPRAIDPAAIKAKLSKFLKPIDAHPFVAELGRMGSLNWRVK